MISNPYKVLGVDRNASKDDIKNAYRKLAKEHHPDSSGGDDTRFKEVNEAYKILTDPRAKSEYEEQKFRNTQRNNPFASSGGFWRSSGVSPEDIFREYMKDGGFNVHFSYGKVKRKTHGESITIRAILKLEDVFHGKTLDIKLDRYERVNSEKREKRNRRIKINVPKGAKSGQELVLRNQGHQGINGGKDGDIIVRLEIKRHNYFIRKNNDLYARISIPFTQAMIGDKIPFSNIDGEKIDVIIPPKSQQDDEIEIPNKGMPVGNSDIRGYLRLIIEITLPTDLSDEEEKFIHDLNTKVKITNLRASQLYS